MLEELVLTEPDEADLAPADVVDDLFVRELGTSAYIAGLHR
jgi:hypothetical protein